MNKFIGILISIVAPTAWAAVDGACYNYYVNRASMMAQQRSPTQAKFVSERLLDVINEINSGDLNCPKLMGLSRSVLKRGQTENTLPEGTTLQRVREKLTELVVDNGICEFAPESQSQTRTKVEYTLGESVVSTVDLGPFSEGKAPVIRSEGDLVRIVNALLDGSF